MTFTTFHWAFLAGGEEPEREGLLFIDTETTGLAGGTGTVAFVLGLARIEDDVVHVRQYFLTSFTAEPAMLDACARLDPRRQPSGEL